MREIASTDEMIANAVALAEILAERKFPKGTILRGNVVHEPGKRPYTIGVPKAAS